MWVSVGSFNSELENDISWGVPQLDTTGKCNLLKKVLGDLVRLKEAQRNRCRQKELNFCCILCCFPRVFFFTSCWHQDTSEQTHRVLIWACQMAKHYILCRKSGFSAGLLGLCWSVINLLWFKCLGSNEISLAPLDMWQTVYALWHSCEMQPWCSFLANHAFWLTEQCQKVQVQTLKTTPHIMNLDG